MQEQLRANALDANWLASFKGIRVLSLDCFDTLLWRKAVTPSDVFFALANSAPFREAGISAPLRAKAETAARRIGWINTHSAEVTLAEIYRQAIPDADEATIAALSSAEVACEIDYCFAFQPVHDLIVQARNQGLKVIIVSDTYFDAAQLKQLLFACVPALEGLIDAVYCSSVHKLSKSDGIWRKLLPLLGVRPDQVLHLGDNIAADLHSPRRFGMQAVHFIQQDDDGKRLLAARAQIAAQVFPECHYRAPVPSYYHAQMAIAQHPDPKSSFGYASLGPILHAFADFVLQERAAVLDGGATLKISFLLRDGYLPGKACAALAGEAIGSELNISRFTATAATLDSREKVVALLSKTLSVEAMSALLKQMLLAPAVGQKILQKCAESTEPEKEFARQILRESILKDIFAASRAFRARLVSHVRKVTGVQSGETLMFVDVGYSGTAQTLLRSVLKQDMNVDLIGRYLIADEVAPHQHDRKGLIDATCMDGRIVKALTGSCISGFEMLCTQGAPSTVDYTETGDPVYSGTAVASEQQETVRHIQQACLRFIDDVRASAAAYKPKPEPLHLAQSAAIDLARLLYLPTPMELACMQSFQFDFNLGTDKTIALWDAAEGARAMRTQGFSYMNAGLDDMRTSYTMELRALDLSLSVMLFAQNRFGFDMQPSSASYRKQQVSVMVTNPREHTLRMLEAHATYDGYYALAVPLAASFDVGILFGKHYTWLQIDSVQLIRDGNLQHGAEMAQGAAAIFDQMAQVEKSLFKVDSGGMLYLPGLPAYQGKLMCRIIFRPIAWTPAEGAIV